MLKVAIYFRKVFSLMAIVFCLSLTQVAYAESNPYQLMQETSDKLFGQITKDHSRIQQDPNYLKTVVEQTLMPYAHVKYAGSKVLGSQYRTLTSEERDRFFHVFRTFIIQAYAQALTLYTNQKIEIEKAKPITGDLVNIRLQIIQTNGAPPVNLNFFWRKNSKTAQWQVYDMAVEGVSMIDTKRQEWSPILRKDGVNALIAQVEKAGQVPVTLSK